MKKYKLGTALVGAMIASAGMGLAGGIERSHSPYAILWEKGNYAELSYGSVNPKISGMNAAGTTASGDMTDSYTQFGLGVKYAVSDNLDLAVVLDQPVGANLTYAAGTGYTLANSTAEVSSNALSFLARYKLDNGFSFHGGVKVMRTKGEVSLRSGAYRMNTSTETDVGYIIGAAYERPDIALRVGLTYQSAITHDFTANESLGGGAFSASNFATEVPKSWTLDFQSGIAENTLVFGSIRWRDWSSFTIDPAGYRRATALSGGQALVAYDHDITTFTLGVGRKFNDNWSGAISFSHEKHEGTRVGNLGPVDGLNSITLGGTYTQDNMKITAGVTYAKNGDATTKLLNSKFSGNKTVGVGVKIGYSF